MNSTCAVVRLWLVTSCVVGILTLARVTAHQAPSDDAVWRLFVQWLQAQPANSDPEVLVGAYRAELTRRHVSARDADAQMRVIWDRVFHSPDGARLLWNKVFAGTSPIFSEEPNALLQQTVRTRTPGTALDIGMGQGRNAVFLAANGWKVTGIDPSDEGIRLAQINAQKHGVTIEAIATTDDTFDLGRDRWDLIVVTYVKMLAEKDADRYWTGLKPGGLVVYENAAASDNRVLQAFLRYRIVRWEDVTEVGEWRRDQTIHLQRLVAEKSQE